MGKEDCKTKLWLAKIISPKTLRGQYYCVKEEEYDTIYDTLEVPNTSIKVSEDEFLCVSDCDDAITEIDDYKIDSEHYSECGITVVDGAEYCSKKSKIKGLIMCLGLVIKKSGSKGMILSHYMTGKDYLEMNKLYKISKLMKEKNWKWEDEVMLTIYRNPMNVYSQEQDESIDIIQNTLDIPSKNIKILDILVGELIFDENGNLVFS